MSLIRQTTPVQSAGSFTPSGDYTRTYTLTGVASGSTLLLASGSLNIKGNVRPGAGAIKSITDSAGGSPTLLRKERRASGDDTRAEHWYLGNAAAGTHTWTVTYDGVGDGAGNYGVQSDTGVLIEIAGTVSSPADTAGATLQGADNIVDSSLGPTATLAQAHELAIATLYTGKDGIALPAGWENVALRQADGSGFSMGVAALEVTVPYPVAAAFTHAAAPYGTAGLLSLFKVSDAAGGGGGGGAPATSSGGYVEVEAQPEARGLSNIEGVVFTSDGTRCGPKLFEFPHAEATSIAFLDTLNASNRAVLRIPIPSASLASLTNGQTVQIAAHDTTDSKGFTYLRGAVVRLAASSGGGIVAAPALVPIVSAGYRLTDAVYQRLWGPGVSVLDGVINLSTTQTGGNDLVPGMSWRQPYDGYIAQVLLYLADGGGNGGVNTARIATLDSLGKPQVSAGTTVGLATLTPGSLMSGGSYVNRDDRFRPLTFSQLAAVSAGQLLGLTIANSDAAPGTNFSYLAHKWMASTNPKPELWQELAGWRVWAGSRTAGSTAEPTWSDYSGTGSGGCIVTPIAQVIMADGRSFGTSPMQAAAQQVDGAVGGTPLVFKNDSTKPFRERFLPASAKTASGLSVLTAKVSGAGGMLVELLNGSTVLGSVLIPDDGNDYALSSAIVSNLPARAWRHLALPSNVVLPAGSTIDMRLTPQNTSVWAMASQRKGVDLGARNFSGAAVFPESYGQHYTGSAWLGANGQNHTTDGGVGWSWPVVLHLAG